MEMAIYGSVIACPKSVQAGARISSRDINVYIM
jgi:hypothetical protein